MDSTVQLISLIISFLYGSIFYLLARFNKYILKNHKDIFKLFINVIFVIDMVILYIYIMFKINYGLIHIYFIFALVLGFIIMMSYFDKIKQFCKIHVKIKK